MSHSTKTSKTRPASLAAVEYALIEYALSAHTLSEIRLCKAANEPEAAAPNTLVAIKMSLIPAAAITSASPTFWQVTPDAPASTCIRAISQDLCVLICGLFETPALSQIF